MKGLYPVILLFLIIAIPNTSKAKIDKIRSKIGPTVNAPIEYKKNLYFLSTTGALFKSDIDLKKPKVIYNAKNNSVTDLSLDGDRIYFGDGLHDTKESYLYIFDLTKEKIIKTIKFNGHIQRQVTFDDKYIYVGQGPGGLSIVDKKTLKTKWSMQKINNKKLHVDSSIQIVGRNICFNSIYNYKAFLCVDKENSNVIFQKEFKESPKMALTRIDDFIVGATTKADLMKSKFDIPSTFFFFNTISMKMDHTKKFRGYNFFPQRKHKKNEMFMSLSTGDLLLYNIKTKKITFVADFPEPFISTPFIKDKDLCAIGIMGQLLCYERGKTQYHTTKKKRYFESPIGVIKKINGKHYIPSRVGYFIL